MVEAAQRRLRALATHIRPRASTSTSKYVQKTPDGSEVDFAPFIGRVHAVQEDVATSDPLRMMATIFDRPESDRQLIEHGVVPRGWLYDIGGGIYLRDFRPEAELGVDGLSGGTVDGQMVQALERLDLTRTMFGGVRFEFHGELRVGDKLRAELCAEDVRITKASSGSLMAIVTSAKRIFVGERLVLEQFSDLVTKQSLAPGTKDGGARKRPEPPADTVWEKTIVPSEIALFSYSAVTFNRQRIHYDSHWTEEVEGYPGLVVHGPFVMQALIDFARDHHPGKTLVHFEMRAIQALFVGNEIKIVGKPSGDGAEGGCDLWAVAPDGTIAQTASAHFAA